MPQSFSELELKDKMLRMQSQNLAEQGNFGVGTPNGMPNTETFHQQKGIYYHLQYEMNLLKKSLSVPRYLKCCSNVKKLNEQPQLKLVYSKTEVLYTVRLSLTSTLASQFFFLPLLLFRGGRGWEGGGGGRGKGKGGGGAGTFPILLTFSLLALLHFSVSLLFFCFIPFPTPETYTRVLDFLLKYSQKRERG